MKTTGWWKWLPSILIGLSASMLGGCTLLQDRLHAAGYFAATQAGYAGRFRLAHGRWPASVNELEEFMCMPGRADRFKLARYSCDHIVSLAYTTEMEPEGRHLRMRFRAKSRALLCSLLVQAPHASRDTQTFPRITINTSVLSCPRGPSPFIEYDGQRWTRGAL